MPAGRPTVYSAEVTDEFCRRVAGGRSTLAVCADLDMPSDTTIYRWRMEHSEFRDKLTQARDDRLEAYADRMDALAQRVIEETELDPQRVNAAVNAIDKAARLQAPKQRVELTGKDGGPIATDNTHHGQIAISDTAAFIADALGKRADPAHSESGPD